MAPHHISKELETLKLEVANVSSTWRRRTHASRLSAQRWLHRQPGVDTRAPWRKILSAVLEATWFHAALVLLLVVDLAAVGTDILKTVHAKSADLNECVEYLESCTCVGYFERREEWRWTYWTSIVILGILLLNVAALIVAFGRAFFLHPLYVLDLVVVSAALVLELTLHKDTAGVIIVITLWRIVRPKIRFLKAAVEEFYHISLQTSMRTIRISSGISNLEALLLNGSPRIPSKLALDRKISSP